MSRPNGIAAERYRVVYTGSVRAAIKRLGDRAEELGIKESRRNNLGSRP
ncbi:MAG: hypothetical protein HYS12_27910 [Planctomycetes bacterium]|nr:hypothetical protein [Planctomycetota bacterium]